MNKPYPFSEINSSLAEAKNIGVLLPDNPEYDLVAASLALFLSLEKAGKTMSIASPSPMRVEFSHLVGLDKIIDKIGSEKGLTISIDYPVDNVEKVSFDDSNKKVNLIVKLKDGVPSIPTEKINFSESGSGFELFFFIGGKDYSSFESLISSQEIQTHQGITITKKQTVLPGKIQIIDPSASSYSEIITAILVSLSLPSDQDIAQNLFLGLSKATADFTSPIVSADTFEAAALCLRAGAKREPTQKAPTLQKPEKIEEKTKPVPPSPDWLTPKIYRGTSLV